MNQSSVEGVVAALLLPAEVAVAAQAAATRNKYDFIFFVGGGGGGCHPLSLQRFKTPSTLVIPALPGVLLDSVI